MPKHSITNIEQAGRASMVIGKWVFTHESSTYFSQIWTFEQQEATYGMTVQHEFSA